MKALSVLRVSENESGRIEEEEEERGLFIAVLMWIGLLWRPGK